MCSIINSFFVIILSVTSILIKLGIAPFHLWILSIGAKLNLFLLLWLLIPQKLIPLSLLFNINYHRNLLLLAALIISTLHSLTQTKIKKIIIISSVFSINWIYIRIRIESNIWLIYFLTYSLISFNVIIILSNDLSITQLRGFSYTSIINQKLIVLIILFISGIPPSPIFFLKIRIVYYLSSSRWVIMLSIMLCSMIMIYIYINSLIFSSLISNKSYFIYLPSKVSSKELLIFFIYLFIGINLIV